MTNPSESNPAALVPDHRATEEYLRSSGLAWTLLRYNVYSDPLAGAAARAMASGQHMTNAGDGRTAYVTRGDCAAVAAAVLSHPGHEGKAYEISGPAALAPAGRSRVDAGSERPAGCACVSRRRRFHRRAGRPRRPTDARGRCGGELRPRGMGYMAQVSGVVGGLAGHAPRSLRNMLEAALEGERRPG
jgi:uncharacterized protein YbjT (DUF2867 family)